MRLRMLLDGLGGGGGGGAGVENPARLADRWLPGHRTTFSVAARRARGTFRSGRERDCNLEKK